jgi:hypothetical protein
LKATLGDGPLPFYQRQLLSLLRIERERIVITLNEEKSRRGDRGSICSPLPGMRTWPDHGLVIFSVAPLIIYNRSWVASSTFRIFRAQLGNKVNELRHRIINMNDLVY